MKQTPSGIKHLPIKLVAAALLMFGFGFALVPLYDVFCDLTGINGKGFERSDVGSNTLDSPATLSSTTNTTTSTTTSIDVTDQRIVEVQFIAQPQAGFSGVFYPQTTSLTTSLNTTVTTAYVARNATGNTVQLQAVPSISPAEAATHVTKMECFCFQQQSLIAGQKRDMGLTFSIKSDLPEHIQKITFSYALYAQAPTQPPTQQPTVANVDHSRDAP